MDFARRSALATGVLFIVTFVTSIPALILYGPVLNDAHYVLGPGADTRVYAGAFLEVLLVISNVGTAVAIFPVVRRQNESIALGYVAARVVESTIIAVGIISLLAVVTLRRDLAGGGTDPATLVVAAKTLVAVRKGSFLLGPGFCAGIENGLMLGYLMYRSGLVPRPMAVLGLIGGTLAFAAGTAELFGLWPQVSGPAFLLVLPEALFEALIGIYLTVKGFRPSPVTAAMARDAENATAVTGPAVA
jgi:uncharacterized protein DUF4386